MLRIWIEEKLILENKILIKFLHFGKRIELIRLEIQEIAILILTKLNQVKLNYLSNMMHSFSTLTLRNAQRDLPDKVSI